MFIILPVFSLVFAAVLGWLLYDAIRHARPTTIKDWAVDIGIGLAGVSIVVTAIKALAS